MSCTIFDFGGILMAICYDKLWKLLIDKKMNRTELKEASGISFNVLARLGKNEPVSFESIEKICFTLNCKIEDVVEIQKDEPIQIDSDAFTTIELFAGAGGLALGIEKAGFEPLGLIEFDKDAAESLKTNRPNWRVIHDDIANISCLDLEDYFGIKKGDLDLLSGGAPCQAFSYAGKRLGLEDARGTLFYHYATFLQKLQPKMFLFENPSMEAILSCWFPILYTGMFSQGIAYTFQVVAQKHADPTSASLILSLESVFSVVAGAIILHEMMSGREIIGCILMFAAIIVAQLPESKAE